MSDASDTNTPGISAISIYLPRLRVDLEQWCAWTGAPWAKVGAVVGRSFRVCDPRENAYTMAANAALRLILQNDLDPRRVGFLGLGTESSTDNAAGAVIVRGMVDAALRQRGLPALARDCEVPEFKHACLGGVYATKAAARYLACEGRGRLALVISSDIAEYQRGSSGEQTQGAGAVAFAMESNPRLVALDLARAGSASSYRGYDFRKPFARHFMEGYVPEGARPRDFPVFNGKYSTLCYIDEVMAAFDGMFERLGAQGDRRAAFESFAAVFMHRPYHHLPGAALATAMAREFARAPEGTPGRGEFEELCGQAGVAADAVRQELVQAGDHGFDLWSEARERGANHDPYVALGKVAKVLRGGAWFRGLLADKLGLGSDLVREVGNLYTASLPAWLAAGFEDAHTSGRDLDGAEVLLVGYGSGDAAEAIPARVMPTWREAAARIGFAEALGGAVDLDREQYEALHDGREVEGLPGFEDTFAVARVGEANRPDFQDIGVEYYRLPRVEH
ncbi:hydroxymethylglutaryl-CoA synthase family protein [Pseudenhygromyxa sp. WMMC2535]|uniref:hydroxymethylglutaryl-CoA synthase family protein n=1 Tax=Pseudenhygromyxa sp. WMMC2535 TaxID=2712867 RepID=UPI001554A66E|nr:hydroxymethylglutaryl-CoA synthase family protein [Pseudenhygromyxa sp. WMMC2535]NVB41328.1 hydroxymethylglutaryl-CoA synthase family protein [Pseudenhygromyxa sp. WMMC2535]